MQDIGKREQAKAQRRSRIIRAARDLIRETGDTDLSMRMLAQRAEVSLSTPYNLFGSKRAVVLAVLEDERDFVERFGKLDRGNSIDRIFGAHELAFSYYTGDPEFYRTLWRALLSTTGQDDMGLATPERLAQTQAIWRALLHNAVKDGSLADDVPADLTLQAMAHTTGGALLSWAVGSLSTAALTPTVGIGYAICLRGVATVKGAPLLTKRIEAYRNDLAIAGTRVSDRSPETL
ncbi:TetR/AcrR family transcriptional regulator [Henriciella marina]|uniref:TetR/AcrR family transcriptional regulator n=1 Tax=Henriciella marina TaxID=453851 RepID=UPI00038065D7|nr:TetR/AcrR family transcriptional regulator [Henriciella marina]